VGVFPLGFHSEDCGAFIMSSGVRTQRYLCVIQAGSLEGITYTFEHWMTDILAYKHGRLLQI